MDELRTCIERLTGQEIPFDEPDRLGILESLDEKSLHLGYSQLNELLLTLGYDRVSEEFFQYLVDGKLKYQHEDIADINCFREGVERFVKLALLSFGNVKFGFKRLSPERNVDNLRLLVEANSERNPEDLTKRHKPLREIKKIELKDT